MLLVREAGGFAGGIDPAGDPLTTGEIIAANAGLFEPFAALVRGG
jgi:myo-inositol-1(or 4)-monophosphatase